MYHRLRFSILSEKSGDAGCAGGGNSGRAWRWHALAAASPELAAAAKAAIQACSGDVVLCLNNVGIQMSEVIVPGGVGAGGAVGIGKTAAEATAAKAEAIAANAAKTGKNIEGSLSGQPTKFPPNAAAEEIRSLIREKESASILSKSGYHVEQNPVTAGVQNPDYKINGEIFDNYAPKSGGVRNIWSDVKGKIDEGQTTNVVINVSDTPVTIDALKNKFNQ